MVDWDKYLLRGGLMPVRRDHESRSPRSPEPEIGEILLKLGLLFAIILSLVLASFFVGIAFPVSGIFLFQIGQICSAHGMHSSLCFYKKARAFWPPQSLLSQG
jgi:hypothetical protein